MKKNIMRKNNSISNIKKNISSFKKTTSNKNTIRRSRKNISKKKKIVRNKSNRFLLKGGK